MCILCGKNFFLNILEYRDFTFAVHLNINDSSTGLDKNIFERKIVNIFLPISFKICFGCSKEPSH